jgi:hypothetical protein
MKNSSESIQQNGSEAASANQDSPIWKEKLLGLDLDETSKSLLQELFQYIDLGEDPDLRIHAIESFFEKCGQLQKNPQELQQQLMDALPEDEIHRLFDLLPKGAVVEVTQTRFTDGSSISATKMARSIIKKHGLFSPSETPGKLEKVDDSTLQGLLNTQLNVEKPTFELTQTVTIIAESIQGYSMHGTRVSIHEIDQNKEGSINSKEIDRFILQGADIIASKRRPRELYPGRRIQYWCQDLQQWLPGRVTERILGDTVLFVLDSPTDIPHPLLGEPIRVKSLEINVGRDAARFGPQEEGNLPELGTASFELHPWLYPNIDLSLEQTESPYEQIPKAFRPGALILSNDGAILRINRSSTQGMAEIDGPGVSDYETVQWIGLEEDQMPEILRESNSPYGQELKGARVVLPDNLGGYICRFVGVFKINEEEEYVVLEALPCWLGNKANIPSYLLSMYNLHVFKKNVEEGVFQVYDSPLGEELKKAFPQQYRDILKHIDPDCGVVVQATLEDGREVNGTYVYLHCLPLGVWCIPENGEDDATSYTPELVAPDQFETFKVVDERTKL